MTTTRALYQFWSSFLPAYPRYSVPEGTAFPYLTYEIAESDFSDLPVNVAVNVYYRTESESLPNAMVKQIRDRIGSGGILLECDGGAIWVKKGSPFCLPGINDPDDRLIKMRQMNIELEYQL